MITMRQTCATLLALGLAVPFAYAGETVTEHESYEKRSMKVEPVSSGSGKRKSAAPTMSSL